MRINVYAEELTDEVSYVEKTAENGKTFYGVRFYLKSHGDLHFTPNDDDRSAITFWIPDNKHPDYVISADDLYDVFQKAKEIVDQYGGTE